MIATINDLRSAWRALAQRKAYSLGALLILAIAIGSNIVIAGVIDALLLRPLPVREADRLVVPQGLQKDTGFNGSLRDLQAWRQARSFDAVAAAEVRQVNLVGDGEAERLNAAAVDGRYLEVFGVRPLIGRFFTDPEALDREAKSVVLGRGIWQRRFGGDPAILGQTILLDGAPHEVVGVLPAEFDMPQQTALWLPSAPDNLPLARQGAHILPTIARLRPGVSLEQAGAELRALARRLASDFPDSHAGWSARVIDLRSAIFADPEGRVRRGLTLLFAGGALLLVIACANFGNILLASSLSRSQEIGTRLAIGATRLSIGRQFLFEGLLLALGAALLSYPVALGATALMLKDSPIRTSAFSQTIFAASLDGPVPLFTASLVLITGVLAGLIPAFQASRLDVVRLMSSSGRVTDGRRSQRVFEITIVGQIALTLSLLIASSAFVESFLKLQRLDLGFRPAGLVAMDLAIARRCRFTTSA
jgi:predicted permease